MKSSFGKYVRKLWWPNVRNQPITFPCSVKPRIPWLCLVLYPEFPYRAVGEGFEKVFCSTSAVPFSKRFYYRWTLAGNCVLFSKFFLTVQKVAGTAYELETHTEVTPPCMDAKSQILTSTLRAPFRDLAINYRQSSGGFLTPEYSNQMFDTDTKHK
jgi:hypothetical protein